MDPIQLLDQLRRHPQIKNAGMVLTHLGLVRGFNLAGEAVESLEVAVDSAKVEAIRTEMRQKPGIVDVMIEMNKGVLQVSDPIMWVAVAGETRETVFPVMTELIERLKREASHKVEHLADRRSP